MGLENLFSSIEEKKKNNIVETLDKNEVVSKYNWEFNEEIVDDETLNFLKEQTFKLHIASNNFYTELA